MVSCFPEPTQCCKYCVDACCLDVTQRCNQDSEPALKAIFPGLASLLPDLALAQSPGDIDDRDHYRQIVK